MFTGKARDLDTVMLAGEVFSIALSNSSGSAGYVHALKDLVVPQRQLIALCVDTRERHHNARETVEIVYRVFFRIFQVQPHSERAVGEGIP